MKIVYTTKTGLGQYCNEKAFIMAPGEWILLILEQEEIINRMKGRTNFSTRACFTNTTIVLFKTNFDNLNVPKNVILENLFATYDMTYSVKPMPKMVLTITDFNLFDDIIYAYFEM